MKLRLLLLGPDRLLGSRPDITLETGAIVIGRSREADWCLEDLERIVSKKHCMVEATGDGFQLTDMSTNGVTINGVPVDRTRPARLSSGDVLALGDAVVRVQIERDIARPTVGIPAGQPAGAKGPDLLDPFGEGPFGFDDASPAKKNNPQGSQDIPGNMIQPDWWIAGSREGGTGNDVAKPVEIQDTGVSFSNATVPLDEKQVFPDERDPALIYSAWHSRGLEAFMAAVRDACGSLPEDHRKEFEKRLESLLTASVSV